MSAEELIAGLEKGKETYYSFSNLIETNFLISGKTFQFWKDKFNLHIQVDILTPNLCQEYGLKILEMSHEATFFYNVALTKTQLIKRGADSKFVSKISELKEEYQQAGKKLPAADTLKALAKHENDNLESAISIGEIEVDFWKQILKHLSMCRKIIENASLNISVELKSSAVRSL